jgi:hypothetical protein
MLIVNKNIRNIKKKWLFPQSNYSTLNTFNINKEISFFYIICLFIVLNLLTISKFLDIASLLLFTKMSSHEKKNVKNKIIYNKIIKRYMMSTGTKLTPYQKQLAVGVIQGHINLLRKKDLNTDDLLNNIVEGVAAYGKVYQHMMVVLYPHLHFQTNTIQSKFPNIGICDNGSGFVDMNFVVAAAGGTKIINKLPFSKNGKLKVLDRMPFEKIDNTSPAFVDTKQKNPDYLFSNDKWTRYYDLKTGDIKPNKGHIRIISSEEDYIELIQKLFEKQLELFKISFPQSSLVNYMETLKVRQDILWKEKYELYKEYLADNLQNYSGIKPSFIIFEKLSYNMANQERAKNIEGIITTNTFSSEEETLAAFRKLVNENTETIKNNYLKLNPLGLGEKKLFTKFMTLIDHVLS